MDSDNPWGAPSPSPASTPLASTSSPPRSPRVSYDSDEGERPAWGAESPKRNAGERRASLAKEDSAETDVTSGEEVEVVKDDGIKDDETASIAKGEDEEQAKEPEPLTPSEEKDESSPPAAEDEAPGTSTAGLSKAQIKRLKKKKSKAKVKAAAEEAEKEGEEVPPLPSPPATEEMDEEPVSPTPVIPQAVIEEQSSAVEEAAPVAEATFEPAAETASSSSALDLPPPSSSEAPPMDALPSDDDFASSSPPPAASPAFPTSFPTLFEAPPMDAFPDDDFDSPAPVPPTADDGFDDFDDFGESAAAGDGAAEDDDFGDFGDFGSSAPLDASAFEAPSLPPPVPVVPTAPSPAPSSAYPPLRLDLTNATRRAVAPQLAEFCRAAWARAGESVNDEPERQVGGVGQVLVEESTRNLLADLSAVPSLRPLDWRRSKIRREHLTSMGIPVNLDDEPKPNPLSLSTSRRFGGPISASPTRSASAPPLSAGPFSPSSAPHSRSSTPFADRERSRASAGPPPLDTKRAEELMAVAEEDLTLMSLTKLRELGDELDRISVEASGVLTHALMMREKEAQDKEVYNGMISDLVSSAAKMKTSSALGRPPPKRANSGRWGR